VSKASQRKRSLNSVVMNRALMLPRRQMKSSTRPTGVAFIYEGTPENPESQFLKVLTKEFLEQRSLGSMRTESN